MTEAQLRTLQDKVFEQVRAELHNSPPFLRSKLLQLYTRPGKGLRATCLLAVVADRGDEATALLFAAAIELLHFASLLHDDVIDQADMRRGQASARLLYGNKQAILLGDFILAKALQLLQRVTAKEQYLAYDYPQYISKLCVGQLREQEQLGKTSLSILEYFRMIREKTASLFELAFFAGAVCATETLANCQHFASIGRNLGLAFQIQDDIADLLQSGAQSGKAECKDIEQRLLTLPILYHFRDDTAGLKSYLSLSEQLTPQLKSRWLQALRSSGAISRSQKTLAHYASKARRQLLALHLSSEHTDLLNAVFSSVLIYETC